MTITAKCGGCGHVYQVNDDKAGKRFKCKECGQAIVVRPGKKKTAVSDEDMFGDSGELETSVPPQRRPPRKKGTTSKAAVTRSSARKGKGAKKGTSWDRRPLIIGLSAGAGVLAVLLLVWKLWPASVPENVTDDPGTQPTVADPADKPVAESRTPAIAQSSDTTASASATPTMTTMPQLPRAVKKLPDWLIQEAPFDVKQFWVTVPAESNAAPLYLDALYELSHHMEVCFPPKVRAQRTPGSKERSLRSTQLQRDWYSNRPAKRNPAERDDILQQHSIAFKRLEEAQNRPRCVFDIGWDIPSQIPLIVAAREAMRVGQMQVERDIERGDFDAVVRMIGIMLRLSRDLRTRSPMLFQDVGASVDAVVASNYVIPALKSPGLTINQCDRMLQLIIQHETALNDLDPFLTGLRGDYVWKRSLVHDVQHQNGEFAESRFRHAFGIANETRGAALVSALNVPTSLRKTMGSDAPPENFRKMLDTLLSGMKPLDFDAVAAWQKKRYQVIADSASLPYASRSAAVSSLRKKLGEEFQTQLTAGIPPGTSPKQAAVLGLANMEKKAADGTLRGPYLALFLRGSFENDISSGDPVETNARSRTRLGATKALVALRRWYGTHSDPPPDIATMCVEAGLPDIPHDFYADAPMLMASFLVETPVQDRFKEITTYAAGETVIYSTGPDGKDDHALKRWSYAPKGDGDFLFSLGISQSIIPVTPAPPAPPSR